MTSRRHILLFFLVCFSVSHALGQQRDEQPVSSKQDALVKPHEVTETITIRGPADGSVYPASLGQLPFGRPVKLELTIANASNDRYNFDEAQVSCSCIKAEVPTGALEPGKTIRCNILLDTSKRQRTHQLSISLKLFDSTGKTEEIIVVLKGYLHGFLGFVDPYISANVSSSDQSADIRVPYTATRPIEGQLVDVKQDPEIGELRIEKRGKSPEKWEVVLKVDPKQIPTQGVATSLTIDDALTGRSTESTLVVTHQSSIRINPRTVRLFKESDANSYSGFAILTIRKPKVNAESSNESPSDQEKDTNHNPVVSARFGGKNVSLTLKRLNEDHLRIVLKVPSAMAEEVLASSTGGTPKLHWSVSSKTGARQITSPIMFQD